MAHGQWSVTEVVLRLGFTTSLACLGSYLWRRLFPIRPELSFENWVRNRFGGKLYTAFFKTYTEKVWGMQCSEISADWASQRIKGLSLRKAIMDAFGFRQKSVKSLIEEFDYPKRGAGMMWEKARDEIVESGGIVHLGRTVIRIKHDRGRVVSIQTKSTSGEIEQWQADAFIISMPLRDCIACMDPPLDLPVREAAEKLRYRDFVLVAAIVGRTNLFPDNWIYVHEPSVKVARIGNYNNWTNGMASANATCLEMEYFCSQEDALWQLSDSSILKLAGQELERIGLAKASEVLDGCILRVEKAYPVYDAGYETNVRVIRESLTKFENLQVAGRNGMHKYNNQDHSMLTGMLAARNLLTKQYNVWQVNTDAEYQEEEIAVDDKNRSIRQPIFKR